MSFGLAPFLYPSSPCFDIDPAELTADSTTDDIIKSAKFPSALAPGPEELHKIETEYRLCLSTSCTLGTVCQRCTLICYGQHASLAAFVFLPPVIMD